MAFITDLVRICYYELKYTFYALRGGQLFLEDIKEQTPNICLWFVKKHSRNLIYVKEQTEEICVEAVKQSCLALSHVKKQTPKICLEAMKKSGWALPYVKEQTPEICLEAVKTYGFALRFVKEQTPEICLEAVKNDGFALQFVKEQTPEICLEAIKKYSEAMYCVNPLIHNILFIRTLQTVCISLKQLQLPSYLLMDIVDVADAVSMRGDVKHDMNILYGLLKPNSLTNCVKIHKVIQINEQKLI